MISKKFKTISLSGISGAAKAFHVLEIVQQLHAPAWVVTKGQKEEEAFIEDFKSLGNVEVLLFPAWEVIPSKVSLPQKEIMAERIDTLKRLEEWREGAQEKLLVVVTSVEALCFKTITRSQMSQLSFSLKKGDSLHKNQFIEQLVRLGFNSYPMVGQRGEFSQRGGIVDFFPLNSSYPVRIEFFGQEVESIREFDAETQLSRKNLTQLDILMADEKEVLLKEENGESSFVLEHGMEHFLVFMDEPEELEEKAVAVHSLYEEEKVLQDVAESLYLSWLNVLKKVNLFQRIDLFVIPKEEKVVIPGVTLLKTESIDTIQPSHLKAYSLKEQESSQVKSTRMIEAIADWVKQRYKVYIFCNNDAEKERLIELLKEKEIKNFNQFIQAEIGRLSEGFVVKKKKEIFLSDQEIFARYKIRRSRWRFRGASVEMPATEIKEGDYVVHVNHGIGKYKGIILLREEGLAQEMMHIEYAEKAALYVPLTESHLVELYQGFTEKVPELDKLGSVRWSKTKLRVERAIRDYASDLLQLQAERNVLKGIPFPKDTEWQKEFENAFIYEETPDQLEAIQDVKDDLEKPKPMDRLLCGDVGYGKTEVAIRAAFKAVMSGKQVAVLVPTTVLAQQHGQTFSERLADYPIVVETLSRFKTKGEQKKVVQALQAGEIDIVIGTHRLVQSDIKFKELGLVIIDEEQRFGVRHKEKLKQMRRMIDVLTMTATPIPRTLYLSLIGVKDMSSIQTAPVDRQPIETHLVEYNEHLIREGILRELNREGQVFFVHNRVETIERMKNELQKLVPEAKMELAHGQMHGDELEMVMRAFVNGQIDVLVCTTIIESGMDIPNANTIFINRTDRFGLAELYQLRGRVGRFKNKAYAYLLLPRDMVIMQEAKKRLKAFMENSSLGAGFKVAMKDLEIRGAGNVLGEQQSGHVIAIGFELYCKLLRKTVERLKEEKTKSPYDLSPSTKECQVRLGIEGAIPEKYIPETQQRLKIYRRIGEAESLPIVRLLHKELIDRFGAVPPEVILLLEKAEISIIGKQKRLTLVELKEGKLLFKRGREYVLPEEGWARVSSGEPLEVLLKVKKLLSQFEGK